MKKINISFLIICINIILFQNNVFSSENAIIRGNIISKIGFVPLPGVTVRIEGTAIGSVSDSKGNFIINHVKPGKYMILISNVGYETYRLDTIITDNQIMILNVILSEKLILTNEVVVSANKRVQAVQDVPISVSVIDLSSMKQRAIARIDDALRYVPGVNLNGDQVSIRGSSGIALGLGSRVALLLDGFPLLSGDNGDIKFDVVPIFDIDRIEVVKGAGSALYGSAALGGVINLITKEPTDIPEFRIKAFSGIYTKPRYEQWIWRSSPTTKTAADFSFSDKIGNLGIILSGNYTRDESYDLYNDYYKWGFFTKIFYSPLENTKINLTGAYAYENHGEWVYWNSLDSATIPPAGTDMTQRMRSTKFTGIAEIKQIFNTNNFLVLRTGLFRTFYINSDDPVYQYLRASLANSINSEIQFNSHFADNTLLTIGINHTWNEILSIVTGDRIQNIIAGYGQLELSWIKDVTATLGGRFDYEKSDFSEPNREFSPKLGLSWSLPLGFKLRASAGRGFRAPVVAERFAVLGLNGFTIIPNLNLKSEKSMSYEIGFNNEFDFLGLPFMADLSIFRSDYDELIEPAFDTTQSNAVIKFQNITKARIQGIELDIKTFLFKFIGLETSLTLMDPRDLTLNEVLKYRSSTLWYTRMMVPLDNFEFQVDFRYVSRYQNVDTRLGFQIKDYDARVPAYIFDARLIYKLKNNPGFPLTFTLNVKNLFDYYYVETSGNLGTTRYISFQIETSF